MKKLFGTDGILPTNKDEYSIHKEEYSDVITKVHIEFTTAGEKLYQQALEIMNSTKLLNEEKVKRLEKMGFTASGEVVKAKEILKVRQLNEATVNLIAYYREQYPLYKFITKEQVTKICEKYGLIWGKSDMYTGFVPEKNLKVMEAFKLKAKDAMYYYNNSLMDMHSPISYEQYKDYKKDNSYRAFVDNRFLIAAPEKDFNIPRTKHIVGHEIVNKPIPDPVVLAPVNGGYLIVTAWGEEANDPLVVNDINN